jgi:hypothetical protein
MSDKTTFVSFLLDETGSIQSIWDDTVGGFNEYLHTLRESGEDIIFSLGAGLDVFAAARQPGIDIPVKQIVSYSRGRSRQAFWSTAQNLREFSRSGNSLSLRYSAAQREDVGDEYAQQYLDPSDEPSRGTESKPKKRGWWRIGKRSTTDDYDLSRH